MNIHNDYFYSVSYAACEEGYNYYTDSEYVNQNNFNEQDLNHFDKITKQLADMYENELSEDSRDIEYIYDACLVELGLITVNQWAHYYWQNNFNDYPEDFISYFELNDEIKRVAAQRTFGQFSISTLKEIKGYVHISKWYEQEIDNITRQLTDYWTIFEFHNSDTMTDEIFWYVVNRFSGKYIKGNKKYKLQEQWNTIKIIVAKRAAKLYSLINEWITMTNVNEKLEEFKSYYESKIRNLELENAKFCSMLQNSDNEEQILIVSGSY